MERAPNHQDDHQNKRLLILAVVLSSIVILSYTWKTRVQSAPKSDPVQRDAHLTQGLAFYREGRLDEALKEYLAAAEVDPRSALAYYNIGATQYAKKNIDAAIEAYRNAVAIDPSLADAQFNLGYVLLHDRNSPGDAVAPLSAATQAQPQMAKAYYELGIAYDAMGLKDQAESMWEAALKIDPGFRDAVAARESHR